MGGRSPPAAATVSSGLFPNWAASAQQQRRSRAFVLLLIGPSAQAAGRAATDAAERHLGFRGRGAQHGVCVPGGCVGEGRVLPYAAETTVGVEWSRDVEAPPQRPGGASPVCPAKASCVGVKNRSGANAGLRCRRRVAHSPAALGRAVGNTPSEAVSRDPTPHSRRAHPRRVAWFWRRRRRGTDSQSRSTPPAAWSAAQGSRAVTCDVLGALVIVGASPSRARAACGASPARPRVIRGHATNEFLPHVYHS